MLFRLPGLIIWGFTAFLYLAAGNLVAMNSSEVENRPEAYLRDSWLLEQCGVHWSYGRSATEWVKDQLINNPDFRRLCEALTSQEFEALGQLKWPFIPYGIP
ncbi:MAG: hypothetical protein LBC25_00410, partial [Holosporales bacterium]|nr:hypothetical protein [Holosporales bacterium]